MPYRFPTDPYCKPASQPAQPACQPARKPASWRLSQTQVGNFFYVLRMNGVAMEAMYLKNSCFVLARSTRIQHKLFQASDKLTFEKLLTNCAKRGVKETLCEKAANNVRTSTHSLNRSSVQSCVVKVAFGTSIFNIVISAISHSRTSIMMRLFIIQLPIQRN